MDCPDTFGDLMAFWGRDEGQEPDEADAAEECVGPATVTHAAIKRATQRWNEFVSVTQSRSKEEVTRAGYTLAASLGMEGPQLDHAVECLKAWTEDPSPHQGTMGLFFGLLIVEEAKLEAELEGP